MSSRLIDARPVAGRRANQYGLLLAAGTALAADVAFDPVHRHVPLCPLHASTGLWCPLCGALRAADSLAHGHLGTAVHYNVLLVAALPFAMLWWLDTATRARRGTLPRRLPRTAVAAVIMLAIVFCVVRNTPWGHALRGS